MLSGQQERLLPASGTPTLVILAGRLERSTIPDFLLATGHGPWPLPLVDFPVPGYNEARIPRREILPEYRRPAGSYR